MDYILQNAKEIMYLCFGGGFFILSLYICRVIWVATRLLRKIDDLTDLFISYIQRPLAMIAQAENFAKQVVNLVRR